MVNSGSRDNLDELAGTLDELISEEESLFRRTGDLGSPAFLRHLRDDAPFVEAFCSRYSTQLVGVSTTDEKGHYETFYTFSDDLGGYTIDGIMGSLDPLKPVK